MAVQENAFRSMIEVMFNGLREDIKDVKKDVIELQKSLEFSQKDVSEIEEKLVEIERAHRIGVKRPPGATPGRWFIIWA